MGSGNATRGSRHDPPFPWLVRCFEGAEKVVVFVVVFVILDSDPVLERKGLGVKALVDNVRIWTMYEVLYDM